MFKIGCHLSSSNGFLNMGKVALSIGANTFQFFTRNPRGGSIRPLDEEDISEFLKFKYENNIGKIVAHAPYTLNPCSKDEKTRQFAYAILKEDLRRMEYLDGQYYNFHPGSHVGQGEDEGIRLICELLNKVLSEEQKTMVLLETMSGKGSEIGGRFEHLKQIIDNTELNDKIGVCLDTCHVNDGGYDIVNELDAVIDEFDSVIGIKRLKAIHLNDSKNELSSHKDRHEKIGEGSLGIEAITRIINHPVLKELPFILETPNETEGYAREIELLKTLSDED